MIHFKALKGSLMTVKESGFDEEEEEEAIRMRFEIPRAISPSVRSGARAAHFTAVRPTDVRRHAYTVDDDVATRHNTIVMHSKRPYDILTAGRVQRVLNVAGDSGALPGY